MSSASFVSIHGKRLGMGPNQLIFDGRPVGGKIGAIADRGRTFYVDSAIDAAEGTSPDTAVGTLDEAFSLCEANRGDTIVVMPNHAETVTGAGGITADVAGVSIIGLGRYNQRPRFLMDGGTTVTFVVSAADVYIENLVFAGGHNTIATCFDIDAVGFHANGIEFEDNTTDEHFVIAFTVGSTTDNTCDGLTIENCRWVTEDSGVTHFVDLTGDCDRVTMVNNYYCADAATGAQMLVQANGDDMNGLYFAHNKLITGATTGDLLIENDQSDNSGIAAFNLCGHHDTESASLIDCDGIRQFENYSTSADTLSGGLLPSADSDT